MQWEVTLHRTAWYLRCSISHDKLLCPGQEEGRVFLRRACAMGEQQQVPGFFCERELSMWLRKGKDLWGEVSGQLQRPAQSIALPHMPAAVLGDSETRRQPDSTLRRTQNSPIYPMLSSFSGCQEHTPMRP